MGEKLRQRGENEPKGPAVSSKERETRAPSGQRGVKGAQRDWKPWEEDVWRQGVKEGLLEEGDALLLAISGGADSTALLRLALSWRRVHGLKLRVMHMEHGLRGEESQADARWVEDICQKKQIPFRLRSCDVKALAKAEGYSLEEAGRIARYEALEEEAVLWESQMGQSVKIALAHHAKDLAETMLFQLLRGSGITGLIGMRSKRGRLIRPLLGLSPEKLRAYLHHLGQDWREDASNGSLDYSRNRLRNLVLPTLLAENPKALLHMQRSSQILAQAEDYLKMQAQKTLERHLLSEEEELLCERRGDMLLSLKLAEEEDFLQRLVLRLALVQLLGEGKTGMLDLGYEHIFALQALLGGQAGKSLDLPHGILALRGYRSLQFFLKDGKGSVQRRGDSAREGFQEKLDGTSVAMQEDSIPYVGEEEGVMEGKILLGKQSLFYRIRPLQKGVSLPLMPYTQAFDYDKIRATIQLRSRCQGDWIQIDRAGHRQTLKQFMINQKIPRGLRGQIPLVAVGEEILWVPGYRCSLAYAVTDCTRRVIEMRREEDE